MKKRSENQDHKMTETKESLVAETAKIMHQNSLIRILLLARSQQNAARNHCQCHRMAQLRMNSKFSVSHGAIHSQLKTQAGAVQLVTPRLHISNQFGRKKISTLFSLSMQHGALPSNRHILPK